VPIRGNPVLQLADQEFRLNPTLRAAARGIADGTTDPYDLLARAAEVSYLDNAPDPVVRQSANGLVEPLTDLAVSGRIAFARFAATPLDEAALRAKTHERLRPVVDADPADVAAAVATVLDRAYAVAWALRGPAAQRAAARAALEPDWIAVSGEDDKPARPVNVPQPSYVRPDTGVRVDLEQFEIPVPTPMTRGSTALPFQPFIQTRFLIVSAVEDPALVSLPEQHACHEDGGIEVVEEAEDDEWTKVLNINVIGVARVTRHALPLLRKSSDATIVNTCSVAASVGLPKRAIYGASKGAVQSLTLSMAADLIAENIRVNCVNPGTADTPWVARLLDQADDPRAEREALEQRQPNGRLVTADEVASAICYLANPAQRSTTGTILAVDSGMHSLRVAH